MGKGVAGLGRLLIKSYFGRNRDICCDKILRLLYAAQLNISLSPSSNFTTFVVRIFLLLFVPNYSLVLAIVPDNPSHVSFRRLARRSPDVKAIISLVRTQQFALSMRLDEWRTCAWDLCLM